MRKRCNLLFISALFDVTKGAYKENATESAYVACSCTCTCVVIRNCVLHFKITDRTLSIYG